MCARLPGAREAPVTSGKQAEVPSPNTTNTGTQPSATSPRPDTLPASTTDENQATLTPRGQFEPRPATIDAANSHIERLQATSHYSLGGAVPRLPRPGRRRRPGGRGDTRA